MSELLIFGFGAILFILTTGATVTFGLYRVHELQLQDMAGSDRITEIEDLGMTEIYRTGPVAGESPRDLPAVR